VNRALVSNHQGFFVTSISLTSVISLIAILFSFVWAERIKKNQTKVITVLLALVSLSQFDTLMGSARIHIYLITFFSVLAGVEPTNSLNLRKGHKIFFVSSAMIFVILLLEDLMKLPFDINRTAFGVLYILGCTMLLFYKPKKVRSRLGYIAIWMAYAVNWVIHS